MTVAGMSGEAFRKSLTFVRGNLQSQELFYQIKNTRFNDFDCISLKTKQFLIFGAFNKTLKMALEDYKNVVGSAAGFVTICQMFSGVFLCKDIYKKGSTNNIPVLPFLGGLVLSVLMYQHALLLKDPSMTTVNLFGFGLNVGYLIFYYLWTNVNRKGTFYKDIFQGVALICLLLGYARIEDSEKVEFRFGLIVTMLLMGLIAAPLFSLGTVIRTKSTESLPFPMILSGFVVSAHWLLYGVIIKNNLVIFQNAVGTCLCFIQLMLFVIFPSKSKKSKKDQ